MLELSVNELKNTREWETFLLTSPEGTFFHSLKWKGVLQKSFPYDPLYLKIKTATGRLVGVCPGFIIRVMGHQIFSSLPYSDYGGTVIDRAVSHQASRLLQRFLLSLNAHNDISYAKICFTNNRLSQQFHSPSSRVSTNVGVMEIDLNIHSSAFIWNKILSKNRRYQIKRFERDGYHAYEARTKADLRAFYRLYFENMKYIGAPPFHYGFIENMWSLLYPENLRILIVGKETIMGSILVFKYGQKTYWSYAGINRNHRNIKRYSVIPYLIWKEIQKAEEEGYRYVNLGSTPSNCNAPNHLQKKRLGGSFFPQTIVWYPLNVTGRVLLETREKAVSVWRRIRNILPPTCRSVLEGSLVKF